MPMGTPSSLTEEERRELEELRASKTEVSQDDKDREELLRLRAEKPQEIVPTHFLHLANGEVVESMGTATHYKDQPVVNSVPMGGVER